MGKRVRYAAARDRRNAELEDRHAGSRCFILGNGPSILGHDLTLLREEVVFCLNSFFYHERLHEIAPNYLCSIDRDLLAPALRTAWHAKHQEHRTQGVVKLFGMSARRVDRRLGLFTDHRVYYLHAASGLLAPLWERETFPVDLTRPLAPYGLVMTDVALPAALYMGCKEIVLLGFDAGEINSFEDYLNYNFYGPDPLYSLDTYRAWYDQFFASRGAAAWHDERIGLWERTLPTVERTLALHGARLVNATPVGDPFPGLPRARFEDFVSALPAVG